VLGKARYEVMFMLITPPCIECHKTSNVEVTAEQEKRFHSGEFVQNVFPDWSPEKRELLITGTHPECWDKIFPDEGEY
jgi:hypothetical protein